MAITQTFVKFNVVGNRKEDYISGVVGASGDGIVSTRLHWIESVSVEDVSGLDTTINIYPNSITASDTEDDPGQFFVSSSSNGESYIFRVLGR